MRAIAWISLVIGPVLLLLLIQAQFLPYHLEWVTWVQRLAVLVDVILLWALWPAVLGGRSRIQWPRLWRFPVLALTSLIPIALAITARFPGEWLDERIGNQQWIPANRIAVRLGATAQDGTPIPTSFHDLLFNGSIDYVTRRRKSLLSNTLVLPSFDLLEAEKIDTEKKLEWAKHTASLRGRHLEGAIFDRADLRKADLTGAFLQSASFAEAQLELAALDGAQLQGAQLFAAQLQGASLSRAHLQGAGLDGANLRGADLSHAQLQGASLSVAQLQGAFLLEAQLQGADLDCAELQGANLLGAQLQGATLAQEAWLGGERRQVAPLVRAQLQGATLERAGLQGTDFGYTTFAGTNFQGADLWRTNFEGASMTSVYMDQVNETPLSSENFATLQGEIARDVPTGERRQRALVRIKVLDPTRDARETDNLQGRGVDLASYQKALAAEFRNIACSGDRFAGFIVHGLIVRMFEIGPLAPKLIKDILAPVCTASNKLSDDDRASLQTIPGIVKPPAPLKP